jgi:wall-associated protein
MKNSKVTLLAVATMAAVAITAQGVHADEINQPNPTEHTELTAGSKDTGKAVGEVAQAGAEAEPTETAVTESTLGNNEPSGGGEVNAAVIEKNGSEIVVSSPEVEVTYPNGHDKYKGFNVEYKNIKFDDSMDINPGDTVKFELPKEVTFQTAYSFDVTNPESHVVGNAVTDPNTGTVVTTFNDYFKSHPLNKQMGLKLDVKYTEEVKYGETKKVSFNGTLRTITVAEETGVGEDEVFAKWGTQDKDDASVINWVIRLNVSRKLLSNAALEDRWSDNQSFVDNSEKIYTVDDVKNWKGVNSAKDYLTAWNVLDGGFNAKFKQFEKVLYIEYKTKLKEAVKQSTNPTNSVKFNADEQEINYVAKVELVGGKGDAKGETKPEPTFEIPKESPKVEIPEFEGGIPGIPEVREKLGYTEPIGTVPFDAPVLDKPEWSGGVVPNEAPMLDLPELEIPDEPVKPTPEPKQEKPSTPTTKTETKKEAVSVVNKVEVKQDEPIETYSAPAQLPETGSDFGVAISLFGLSCLMVGSWLKKED